MACKHWPSRWTRHGFVLPRLSCLPREHPCRPSHPSSRLTHARKCHAGATSEHAPRRWQSRLHVIPMSHATHQCSMGSKHKLYRKRLPMSSKAAKFIIKVKQACVRNASTATAPARRPARLQTNPKGTGTPPGKTYHSPSPAAHYAFHGMLVQPQQTYSPTSPSY